MKKLIASVAAMGLVAGPAFAAPAKSSTTTKTMTTRTPTAKATTTTTTKVTPVASKGTTHAVTKTHKSHSKAALAHAAKKPAPKSKTNTTKRS